MIRLVVFVILAVFLASPSAAQIGCQERSTVMKWLKGNYQEVITAVGLTNDGKLVEFASSKNGKTWTLILTDAKSISCLITAGQDWTIIRPLKHSL